MGYMKIMGMGMPAMAFLPLYLICAMIVEIGGGLAILLGYKMKLASWILFAFLIPVTLIFHHAITENLQVFMFLKNLSIMGGLLLLTQIEPGPYSLDGRQSAK